MTDKPTNQEDLGIEVRQLLQKIIDLEDSLRAWRRNAELADQDNRRLELENNQLKKEINRLLAAHESTVNLYSLARKG